MHSEGYHPERLEEEDSYFVSMADILTGLLFLFIIIAVYFAIDSIQKYEKAKQIEDYQQIELDLEKLNNLKEELKKIIDGNQGAMVGLMGDINTTFTQAGLKGLLLLAEKGIISYTGKGWFATGDYEISKRSQAAKDLSLIAKKLVEKLRCHSYQSVSSDGRGFGRHECGENAAILNFFAIEGHTDNTPFAPGGPIKNNLELSYRYRRCL